MSSADAQRRLLSLLVEPTTTKSENMQQLRYLWNEHPSLDAKLLLARSTTSTTTTAGHNPITYSISPFSFHYRSWYGDWIACYVTEQNHGGS